jgi:NAD(P)-dependent dehydrogenase (short-subunit alcohol dehydrogenase family)
MQALENRVVLITGANGGLGAFVTNAFLRSGARVVGASRRITSTEFDHPNFTAVSAELTSKDGSARVIDDVLESHGRLDTLVHLVGAWAGGELAGDTSDETFERMFDLNLRSAFHIIRAALPSMQANATGRILAVGARAGVEPLPNSAAYSASKAALISLVRSVALEYGRYGISANIVMPATMDTPANRAALPTADFSQWVHPCQVAEMLVHLASPAASDVNGAAIPMYGRVA